MKHRSRSMPTSVYFTVPATVRPERSAESRTPASFSGSGSVAGPQTVCKGGGSGRGKTARSFTVGSGRTCAVSFAVLLTTLRDRHLATSETLDAAGCLRPFPRGVSCNELAKVGRSGGWTCPLGVLALPLLEAGPARRSPEPPPVRLDCGSHPPRASAGPAPYLIQRLRIA